MAKIVAVNSSRKKSVRKSTIVEGVLRQGYGLIDDAHADCNTHRQVSLLAMESVNKMQEMGVNVRPGDFAENLTTEAIDLVSLPVGTQLSVGKDIILEVSQIGKECHTKCAIFRQVGTCVMPTEGIFATVIRGGVVKRDDEINILEAEK